MSRAADTIPAPADAKAQAYADFQRRVIEYGRQRLRWSAAGNYDGSGHCRWCNAPVVPPRRFCGPQCRMKHMRRFLSQEAGE